MWARIENGLAVELIEFDPKGRFHESTKWVKCDVSTEIGATYANGVFGPKSSPDISVLANDARSHRDKLLRDVYDIAVIKLKRAERLGQDVSAKLAEFDDYAILLLNVPQQEGFPTTINWPVAPDA